MDKIDMSLVARVTEKCNLECKYCYLDHKQFKDMNLETVEKLIFEFLSYNDDYAHFTWIGGEPLLRPNFFFKELIKFSKKHNNKKLRISHSIQTNGLLLTKERRNSLKRIGFKIGVSYDGCRDLQDIQRPTKKGKTSSSVVLKNIKDSKKEVGILTVLTKKSVGREQEIYEFLREMTTFARLNFYAPTGKGLAKQDELLPSKQEATEMLLKFYEFWKNDDSQLQLKPFSEIVRSFFTGLPINCEYSAVSCYRLLASDTEGNIYTCSRALHMPEMGLGNIHNQSLDRIVGSPIHSKILERYLYLKEKTKDPWFFLSSGGCPVEAYSFTGDMMNETYYGGKVRKILFDKINEDLKDENKRKKFERKVGIAPPN